MGKLLMPSTSAARPVPVVVCGESAGGNLAAVTCLRLRSNRRVAIRYQILLQARSRTSHAVRFPSTAMPAKRSALVRAEDCVVLAGTMQDSVTEDPRSRNLREDLFRFAAHADQSPPNTNLRR
jgi:acetyl esterase/lipase